MGSKNNLTKKGKNNTDLRKYFGIYKKEKSSHCPSSDLNLGSLSHILNIDI